MKKTSRNVCCKTIGIVLASLCWNLPVLASTVAEYHTESNHASHYAASALDQVPEQVVDQAEGAFDLMLLNHQIRTLEQEYYQRLDAFTEPFYERFLDYPRIHSGAEINSNAELVEVLPGSPADLAGMQVGDRLLEIDEIVAGDDRDGVVRLQWAFRRLNPGDLTSVTYERDGERQTSQVQVIDGDELRRLRLAARGVEEGEVLMNEVQQLEIQRQQEIAWRQRQAIRNLSREELLGVWDGLLIVSLTNGLHEHVGDLAGVMVLTCDDADHPLQAGDVITHVGKNPPKDAQHAVQLFYDYAAEASVPVSIQRHGFSFVVNMTYPSGERF